MSESRTGGFGFDTRRGIFTGQKAVNRTFTAY